MPASVPVPSLKGGLLQTAPFVFGSPRAGREENHHLALQMSSLDPVYQVAPGRHSRPPRPDPPCRGLHPRAALR